MKLKLTHWGYFVLITLLFSNYSLAQNTQNQIDTTGNVGVGVMNPTHKLEVNGRTRIDSTLEVRDSATFRRKVRIDEDLIIEGKTFMRDNGVANQNFRVQNGFRVDGISRFYNNVFVDSTFRVETLGLFNGNVRVNGQLRSYGTNNFFSTARFHDELRLLDLTDPSGQNEEGMMFLTGNGKVIRKEMVEANSIDSTDFLVVFDSNGNPKILPFGSVDLMSGAPQGIDCGGVGTQYGYTPTWSNDVGRIWTGGGACDGKVGINISEPLFDLDVEGVTNTNNFRIEKDFNEPIFTTMTSQANNAFLIVNRDYTSLNFRASNSPNYNGEWGIEYNPNDGGLNFWKPWPNNTLYGNHFLFLRDDGNVGIGTATPKYKLSVEGTIGAREIIVEMDSWNDIVFEKDYNLMSVNDLKLFIATHKHLPEIPSEKEVVENGVKMKEMVSLQMKKIEELTLYMIQQQEEIENLKKEIEELKEGGE